MSIRGYLQADERFYIDTGNVQAITTFILRRARPILEGTVFQYFGFKIMPDFGQGNVTIQDAYADFKPLPEIALRVGKFKPPVGLERLQSARFVTFIERGLPTNLVPNRDVGAQLFGDLAGGVVHYEIGVFNGIFDGGVGDGENNDAKDFEARIFFFPARPLRKAWLDHLGMGVGFSQGTEAGTPSSPNLPTYKSITQLTFFSYLADGTAAGTVIAGGGRTRFSPQAYWYAGPFGLLAEYYWTAQNVQKGSLEHELNFNAWQVAGSFVIGGRPTFDGVIVNAPVDPRLRHYGALEIAARYGEQHNDPAAFALAFADSSASAQATHAASAGLNWHLNKFYKIDVDYEFAEYVGGGKPNRSSENSVFTRVQVAF